MDRDTHRTNSESKSFPPEHRNMNTFHMNPYWYSLWFLVVSSRNGGHLDMTTEISAKFHIRLRKTLLQNRVIDRKLHGCHIHNTVPPSAIYLLPKSYSKSCKLLRCEEL